MRRFDLDIIFVFWATGWSSYGGGAEGGIAGAASDPHPRTRHMSEKVASSEDDARGLEETPPPPRISLCIWSRSWTFVRGGGRGG